MLLEKPSPIFIGCWTRISFSLGEKPIGPSTLQFRVPDDLKAGKVFFIKENGQGDPIPLLIVGGLVEDHKLEMLDDAGNLLALTSFLITTSWYDDDKGPPGYHFNTPVLDGGVVAPPPSTHQDLDAHKYTGVWKLLVLIVDTSLARWALGSRAADRAPILDQITRGSNGTARSARQYYEEHSAFRSATATDLAHGLTIEVHNSQPLGLVALPNAWTD